MTPDSAWRQYRGATRDLATAELRLHEARNVWLTTLLEEFAARLAKADEAGQDVKSKTVLAKLGIPCSDCLLPVPDKGSGHSIVYGGADARFKVWATCGKAAVDPTQADMPEVIRA